MPSFRIAPFVLEPKFDARPWGTRKLAPLFDCTVPPDKEPIGEAWLTGEDCKAKNDHFHGTQLRELCQYFGSDIVGTASHYPDRFPLLLKFLFTQDRLSVQVHPDDRAAQAFGEPCGKTECWYVIAAEPGTTIALGLKSGVDKLQLQRAVEETRAEELLNWLDVHPGEMVYVAAGTVHTIGPGATIFEVQQNSDLTYRLYDYGRPRQLHLREGLTALKEVTSAGKVAAVGLGTGAEQLISADHFIVEKYEIEGTKPFCVETGRSPQCLVALKGNGVISGGSFVPIAFERSEAVIIPACIGQFSVEAHAPLQLIRCFLP